MREKRECEKKWIFLWWCVVMMFFFNEIQIWKGQGKTKIIIYDVRAFFLSHPFKFVLQTSHHAIIVIGFPFPFFW